MQYPTYVSPDNIPVDISKPVPISFRFTGVGLTALMLRLYDCDTGSHVGVVWIWLYSAYTVYNGETLTINHDLSNDAVSGKDYQYTLTVCQNVHDVTMFSGYTSGDAEDTSHVLISKGTEIKAPYVVSGTEITAHYIHIGSQSFKVTEVDNSGDYTKLTVDGSFSSAVTAGTHYTIKSNYLVSKPYKMLARTPATVTASAAVSDDGVIECSATYSQPQGIQIKKYKWDLYKVVGSAAVKVAESAEIYNAKLSYTFTEYVTATSQYKAVCTVTDQYNGEISSTAELTYTRSTTEAVESAALTYDSENQCVKLKIDAVAGLGWAWYNVYRQETGSDKIRMIGRCGGSTDTERYITDYLIQSGKIYKYYISPTKSDRTVCATYTTEEIAIEFDEWSVTALSYHKSLFDYETYSTGSVLKFGLDAKIDSVKSNRQIKVSETVSGLPLVCKSDKEYVTGTFSALIGSFGMEYIDDDISQIEKISEFLSSSGTVLIKSPKGLLYLASITSQSYSLDCNIVTQPTTVSIGFTETLKPEKIIINYEY